MQQTGLFLLGLLVALAFWPGTLDYALAPRWAVLAVGIPILALTRATPVALPGQFWGVFGACCLLPSLTLLWSPDPLGGLDLWFHLLILAGAVYLGAITGLGPVWRGLAVGVGVSGLIAVAQLWGLSWFDQAVPPAGLFANRNMLAEAGVVGLIVALGTRRWWLLPFLAMTIVLPVSRAALGGLAVVFIIWWFRRGNRVTAAAGATALILITMAAILHGGPSVELRAATWTEAINNLSWLGNGLGSFAYAFPKMEFAHSEPVQALYELGVFAVPFIVLAIYAFVLGDRDAPEFYILAALLAISLFSFPFHMPLTAFAAALCVGHLAAAGLRVRVDKPSCPILLGGSGRTAEGGQGTATHSGQGKGVIPALCAHP